MATDLEIAVETMCNLLYLIKVHQGSAVQASRYLSMTDEPMRVLVNAARHASTESKRLAND